MVDAPQQDWSYYEARSRAANAEWLRSLTSAERLAMYEDLFQIYWDARRNSSGNLHQLDQSQWDEKLAMRRRLIEAFRRMDEHQRGSAAAKDPG